MIMKSVNVKKIKQNIYDNNEIMIMLWLVKRMTMKPKLQVMIITTIALALAGRLDMSFLSPE